jgi:hypothetical protein
LGRLAANLGISSQALYDWQHISERFGGSAEDANASFGRLNHAIQELKRGVIAPEFERLSEIWRISAKMASAPGSSSQYCTVQA